MVELPDGWIWDSGAWEDGDHDLQIVPEGGRVVSVYSRLEGIGWNVPADILRRAIGADKEIAALETRIRELEKELTHPADEGWEEFIEKLPHGLLRLPEDDKL